MPIKRSHHSSVINVAVAAPSHRLNQIVRERDTPVTRPPADITPSYPTNPERETCGAKRAVICNGIGGNVRNLHLGQRDEIFSLFL